MMMFRVLIQAFASTVPLAAFAADVSTLLREHIELGLDAAVPVTGELSIKYSPDLTDAVLLHAFWMDQSTGQFVADVLTENGDIHRLSGTALLVAPVPVPARQLLPGEIISRADLKEVRVPIRRVTSFAVTDLDSLVGMEVKRLLGEGRLVMAQSVMPPRAIERGERVKIIFQNRGLSLTATGRALNDAAFGEDVKVVNLSSNISVIGVATSDGTVEIVK